MKKYILAAAHMLAATVLAAATLDVDLNITHGISTDGELATSHSVVYLVIDRSGSMGEPTLDNNRTPNDALLESLELQLKAIQGAEVHVLPFSSTIWEEMVYKDFGDADCAKVMDFVKEKKPNGQTLLYAAEDLALTAAGKILKGDASADVRVIVYTDGEHLTPWNYEGEYKARYQIKRTGLGKRGFVVNPDYASELAAAKKKFNEKFADLMANPNCEVEYEWLSKDPKPESVMRTKPAIPVELNSHTPSLMNPLEYPNQTFKGGIHLPLTEKCWEEVVGKPFTVTWTVGGKTAKATLALKDGRQTCKVEWPSLPAGAPEKAALTCVQFPEGHKFILKDTKSVNYDIPAIQKVTMKLVEPEEYDGDSESATLRVGTPVQVKVKLDGGVKSVQWTFEQDGKEIAKITSTVKNGFATDSFVPKAGGLYDVSVTVESLAGKKQTEWVQIYVKPLNR